MGSTVGEMHMHGDRRCDETIIADSRGAQSVSRGKSRESRRRKSRRILKRR